MFVDQEQLQQHFFDCIVHIYSRSNKIEEDRRTSMCASKYLELVREHLQDGLLVHGLLVGPEVVEPLDHTLLQIVTNLTNL